MEIQNPQLFVACQVIICHYGDVVEGQVQSQGLACYHGNMNESVVGAVAGEVTIAAIAGRPAFLRLWPLTQTKVEEEEEEDGEGAANLVFYTAKSNKEKWA